MDNAEEVLQALDEFQKMQPSEIPRELEDYLSFVAKTGDPVYQWSLIKPLFREKLVRVMTDFYENCPTLDLASSPNIEHFNYDIMKCNLLELLESFANAPFTVQRICELLTSPRKEYNRVDKFMRAIEKNILVVSTKEPGPTARRSENGDSVINGTIDDDESMSVQQQPTNEVEMESWVKDCTTDANAPISVPPYNTPSIVTNNSTANPISVTKMSKDLMADNDTSSIINDKNVESSLSKSSDMTVSSFIAAAHEMPNATNVTSTLPSNINISNDETLSSSSSSSTSASLILNNVQNSSENLVADNNDIHTTVGDVPDAIINEDTSSQPSLDSESDDNEAPTVVGNKKLQTTFQTKDFVKMENGDENEDDKVNGKYYSERDSKIMESKLPPSLPSSSFMVNNETDINVDSDVRLSPIHQCDEATSNSDDESKSSSDSNPESIEKRLHMGCENEVATSTVVSTTVVPVVTDRIDDSETNFTTGISTKNHSNTEDKFECNDPDNKLKVDDKQLNDKNEKIIGISTEKSSDNLLLQSESLFLTPQSQQNNQESSSESTIDSENSKDSESITESSEDSGSTLELSSKPIIEEPPFDNITEISQKTIKISESITNTIIVESLDNDIKETTANSLISDPILIIEEPKDMINTEAIQTSISELSADNFSVKQINDTEILQTEQSQISSVSSINNVQTMNVLKSNAGVSIAIPTSSTLTTNVTVKNDGITALEHMKSKNIDTSESMEIDSEDAMSVFQRINDDNGDEPMEQENGESIKS